MNLTEQQLQEFTGPAPLRDEITGKSIRKGNFRHDWQEFVINRQNDLDKKIGTQSVSSNYLEIDKILYDLLKEAANDDDELLDKLHAAVTKQEHNASFMSYNKGFYEGIKFATMAGEL